MLTDIIIINYTTIMIEGKDLRGRQSLLQTSVSPPGPHSRVVSERCTLAKDSAVQSGFNMNSFF